MPDTIMGTDRDELLTQLLLAHEISQFNADYAAALDAQLLDDWATMFTEDAFYTVTARENAEHDQPVGLIWCEGRAMIQDRAFALQKTAMFAPRYLRHIIGNLRVRPQDGSGEIRAEASYAVFQVLFDRPVTTIHQVGRYDDIFRREGGVLKLASRRCIYDSLLIDNALCLPV